MKDQLFERAAAPARERFVARREHPAGIRRGRIASRAQSLLVAFLLASFASCQTTGSAAPRRPLSLLLVTLDTTRSDFTTPYGAPANYTPALARLARQGATLEAVSQLDVTNPSHVSIMTGLQALQHGIFNNLVPLPPDLDTLPAAFHRAGYATGAFVSVSHLGVTPGWQGFDVLDTATKEERRAGDTAARARAWLRGLPDDRPFFAWVHFFDPHWLYEPPKEIVAQLYSGDPNVGDAPWLKAPPWSKMENLGFLGVVRDLAYVRALYAGEVRTMDDALGEVLDELAARGRADRTVVVVVADHGESLGEHNIFFDHVGLYEQQLRIPLVVRVPGFPQGVRPAGLATHIDLAPTFQELFPIELQHALAGRSLVPLLRGAAAAPPRALVNEHAHNRFVALRSGDLKLLLPIWWHGDKAELPELYDLRADPGETVNLASARPDVVEKMSAELAPWQKRGRVMHPRAKDIDPEEAARLRALGYLR